MEEKKDFSGIEKFLHMIFSIISFLGLVLAVIFSLNNMKIVLYEIYLFQIIISVIITLILSGFLEKVLKDEKTKRLSVTGSVIARWIPVVLFCALNCIFFGSRWIIKKNGKIITNQNIIWANPGACDEIFYLERKFFVQREVILFKDNTKTILGSVFSDLWWEKVPSYLLQSDYSIKIEDYVKNWENRFGESLSKVFQNNFYFNSEILKNMKYSCFEFKKEQYIKVYKKILKDYFVGWNGKFYLKNIRVVK